MRRNTTPDDSVALVFPVEFLNRLPQLARDCPVNRYNRTIADALTHTVHVRVKGMNDKSLIPAPGEAVDGT